GRGGRVGALHRRPQRTGRAEFALGGYSRAVELVEQSLTGADERPGAGSTRRLFASWSQAWLAMALSNLGRFVEALSHATEAVRIAEAVGHPFTLVEALTAHEIAGHVALLRGPHPGRERQVPGAVDMTHKHCAARGQFVRSATIASSCLCKRYTPYEQIDTRAGNQ